MATSHMKTSPGEAQHQPVPLEVRVLEGELRGARATIDASHTVKASPNLRSDVVLRSDDLGGRTIAFRAQGDAVLVMVRGGDAQAGGKQFKDGERFVFPLYRPLRLGGLVIAFGQPDHPEWQGLDASNDEDAHADPLGTPTDQPLSLSAPHANAARGAAHKWSKWLALAGFTGAVVSMGVLALAYAIVPAGPTPEQQLQASQAELRHAGLTGLTVSMADGGAALQVSGYLDKAAQRAKAEQLMAHRALPAQFNVWVNEDLVMAVRDVFRVHGVPAEIKPLGPGVMLAETNVADVAQLESIKTVARRDVTGLTAIEVHNVAPPPPPDPVPVIDDAGKRVSSIVPGEPAYVVTADGTRYFQGALLPTGHRIVAVKTGEVLLERGGQTTALQF
jgi:type III secretion protein D